MFRVRKFPNPALLAGSLIYSPNPEELGPLVFDDMPGFLSFLGPVLDAICV